MARVDHLIVSDDALISQCEVDRYRASGPGGQHRNKTESAVRLRHKLTGVSAIKGLFQYSMRVRLVGISRDIENDLRNDLYGHLVQLAPEFFQKYRTGDLLSRSTSDLNAVRMMLGPGVMYWFETMLTLVLAASPAMQPRR